jgi:hypothetical protein
MNFNDASLADNSESQVDSPALGPSAWPAAAGGPAGNSGLWAVSLSTAAARGGPASHGATSKSARCRGGPDSEPARTRRRTGGLPGDAGGPPARGRPAARRGRPAARGVGPGRSGLRVSNFNLNGLGDLNRPGSL